jgi:hypothetical protein
MNEKRSIGELLTMPAVSPESDAPRAPSKLKSRIYSALVEDQAAAGPLLSLTETKTGGHALCIFEELVQISPVGESLKQKNCCRVCHARVLAERIERAPVWWPNCPYVLFQGR